MVQRCLTVRSMTAARRVVDRWTYSRTMVGVRCQFLDWESRDAFPAVVRLVLVDVTGAQHQIVDKEPVLLGNHGAPKGLVRGQDVYIGGVEHARDAATCTVGLAHAVESTEGARVFTVALGSIRDLGAA